MSKASPSKGTAEDSVQQRYYSVREASLIAGVSADTVRRMINSHQLRAGKFGRSLRIPAEAIEEAFQWVGGDAE